MHNRVQRALARREQVRRLRDYAWTVFTASAVAAAFGAILLIDHVTSNVPTQWWVVLIYAAIGLAGGYVAFRAFGAGKRLARQLDTTQALSAPDEAVERPTSVWDEIWRRHGS